jgi:hypothetical protein
MNISSYSGKGFDVGHCSMDILQLAPSSFQSSWFLADKDPNIRSIAFLSSKGTITDAAKLDL